MTLKTLFEAPQTQQVRQLIGRAYHGIAECYKMQGDSGAALKASRKAAEYKPAMSKEERSVAGRTLAKSLDPLHTKVMVYNGRGKNRTFSETRVETEVPIPLPFVKEKELTLKYKNIHDTGKGMEQNSNYVVVEGKPIKELTLGAEGKIPGTTYTPQRDGYIKRFRRYDFSPYVILDTPKLSLNARADLAGIYNGNAAERSLLSSYYGSAFYKFERLQLGIEGSYYRFSFADRDPAKFDLGLTARWGIDLAEWLRPLGLKLDNDIINFHLMAQAARIFQVSEKQDDDRDLNALAAGGGLGLNLPYVIVNLDYHYRQQFFLDDDNDWQRQYSEHTVVLDVNVAPAIEEFIDWIKR